MITTLLTIFWLSFVWAMSPGPDLIVLTKNVVSYGRSHWFATAFGISLALFTYSMIAATGVWLLIQDNPEVFMLIKIAWSLYLAYLGYCLLTKKSITNSTRTESTKIQKEVQSHFSSFTQGYLTNIWNPKVIIFIVAVFSQLLWSDTSTSLYTLSSVSIASAAQIRFSIVSCLLWHSTIQTKLNTYQWVLDRVFWVLLLILASLIILG